MKKTFMIAAPCIAMVLFLSCRKDASTHAQDDLFLAKAKKYFDEKVAGGNLQFTGTPNPRQQLKKTALWDEARVSRTNGMATVILPVRYDQPFAVQARQEERTMPQLSLQSHLVIRQGTAGTFETSVATYLPGQYLEGNGAGLNGCILEEDWAGNRLTTYIQKDGTLYKLTKPQGALAGKLTESGCIHINWFLCSVSEYGTMYDCVYQYTEDIGCNEGLEPVGDEGGCEIPDLSANVQVVSEQVSSTVTGIDAITKYKKLKWRILKGLTWGLYSNESGIIKLVNGTWTWQSLEHVSIEYYGTTWGGTITHTQGIGTPSFTPGTPNVRYGGMSVSYSVTYHPLGDCFPFNYIAPAYSKPYTSSAIWSAEPNN